ncbi:hypothetical protein SSYRP_v1c07860 [Spiroplasma syrphidicola EA-1]|uniref:Uncharacterized protein n=1 Tax=Spiroplasma syrphidicola EA-1 TaxID=1276229 RepID=R4UMB5_9MOLU|nr:hypothetical protein SSYRP_v1c07860 [Spiroplasma syrphidicola EA-1]
MFLFILVGIFYIIKMYDKYLKFYINILNADKGVVYSMLFLLLGGISLSTTSVPSLYQSINLLKNNRKNSTPKYYV